MYLKKSVKGEVLTVKKLRLIFDHPAKIKICMLELVLAGLKLFAISIDISKYEDIVFKQKAGAF